MNYYHFLSNGVKIPQIMIGTYNIFGDEAKTVFQTAYADL